MMGQRSYFCTRHHHFIIIIQQKQKNLSYITFLPFFIYFVFATTYITVYCKSIFFFFSQPLFIIITLLYNYIMVGFMRILPIFPFFCVNHTHMRFKFCIQIRFLLNNTCKKKLFLLTSVLYAKRFFFIKKILLHISLVNEA